jgi:phage-related minor tail protein
MWFFDGIAYYFGSVSFYLGLIASRIESIPLLGVFIAAPFRWAAGVFDELAKWTKYASTWADQVAADLSRAFSYALGLFNQAMAAISQALAAARDYAYGLFSQVAGMISSAIAAAIAPIWSTLSSLTGALDQVKKDLWGGTWIASLIGPITAALLPEASRSFPSLEGAWIALVDKVLDLLKRQAARYASALWEILEAVLRALPGVEG